MISKLKFQLTDFIKELDPRALLLFYVLFIAIVLIQNPLKQKIIVGVFTLIFLLMLFSGYPLSQYIKRLLAIYPMIFFVTIMLPLTDTSNTGEIFISILGTKIYKTGLDSFIILNIKMLFIFALSLLITKICGTFRLLKSLESLNFPVWIISILLYMRHLFYLLSSEQSRIQTAFHARYRYLPIIKRINVLRGISIVFLTRTIERSDRIYTAMLSKGFSGKIPNTIKTNWRISDTLFSCGFVLYFWVILYAY